MVQVQILKIKSAKKSDKIDHWSLKISLKLFCKNVVDFLSEKIYLNFSKLCSKMYHFQYLLVLLYSGQKILKLDFKMKISTFH